MAHKEYGEFEGKFKTSKKNYVILLLETWNI